MPRHKIILNRNWKFIHGDHEQAQMPDFDDSLWYDIGLPHTFSLPYNGADSFYVGYGCYRKWFTVPGNISGQCISVEFGAAFQHARIYVNGRLAGIHKGGYTAFCVDVTPFVHAGPNLLAVRLDNHWDPAIAPRAGEHTFCGGLYRDVYLLASDKLHIAWYGTFITTPEVNENFAKILVQTELVNQNNHSCSCVLQTVITDPAGNEIDKLLTPVTVDAGETAVLTQNTQITDPRLWSPESPSMYRADTAVLMNGVRVDSDVTEFGVRWFSFSAEKGFFLNGSRCLLQGANVHQDRGGWGDAATHSGIRRDLQMMKDCGMNFIRGSHYPHHTVFADECDRLGLLFWSELCYWGIGGFTGDNYWFAGAYPPEEKDMEAFEKNCSDTLIEMIRTHRNHPSIITWSMGNEVFFTDERVMDKAKNLVLKLAEISRREDPTRPVSIGGAQRCGFDLLTEIAGYNGDGATLFHNPSAANLVSEYGSVEANRPGKYSLNMSEGSEELYDWRSGRAIWCGFHHGSIANIGRMGIADLYRLPLRSWFCYREKFLKIKPPEWPREGIPDKLVLRTDKETISADGTDDCQLVVTLCDSSGAHISNNAEILLEIISGPGIFPAGKSIRLSPGDFSFLDGTGAMEMRAYYSGTTVIRASCAGIEPALISIVSKGAPDYAGQPQNFPPKPPDYVYSSADSSINLAKNRPCSVSSEQKRFDRSNCNNENESTYWLSGKNDREPWCRIDLENNYEIDSVRLLFSRAYEAEFCLELSADCAEWEEGARFSSGKNLRVAVQINNKSARYIRLKQLCSKSKDLGIRDFSVFGRTVKK